MRTQSSTLSFKPRQQAGIALITALLVVALASIAAAAILSSASIAIHRSGSLQDSEKAWWYADGVESWVKTIIDRTVKPNSAVSLADEWAKPVDYLPIDEGVIRGGIEDLQGRLNLNNFGQTYNSPAYNANVLILERLLLLLEADPAQAKVIAAAIHDWIDKDTQPSGFDGAEDADYLSLELPYRTAGQPLESVSEVLAIKGMTKDIFYKLTHCAQIKTGFQSCITALPQITPINVNTAPEPILRALLKEPSSPALGSFLETRTTKPYISDGDAFQAAPKGFIAAADGITTDMVSVKSNYFLMHTETFIGSGRVALYSFFYRPASGATIVLGRSTDIE
ncbi:MAG: type II secretion system minor pseudopilin GspK [Pseudomonadota bacterium]